MQGKKIQLCEEQKLVKKWLEAMVLLGPVADLRTCVWREEDL